MPYVVVRTLWPFSKKDELIKKAIEVRKKYPEDNSIAEQNVSATRVTLEGVRTLGVWEVKKGKLEELLDRLAEGLVMLAEVDGITSTTEIWSTAIEAWARLGQTPPNT